MKLILENHYKAFFKWASKNAKIKFIPLKEVLEKLDIGIDNMGYISISGIKYNPGYLDPTILEDKYSMLFLSEWHASNVNKPVEKATPISVENNDGEESAELSDAIAVENVDCTTATEDINDNETDNKLEENPYQVTTESITMYKTCDICNRTLPTSAFQKKASKVPDWHTSCKLCKAKTRRDNKVNAEVKPTSTPESRADEKKILDEAIHGIHKDSNIDKTNQQDIIDESINKNGIENIITGGINFCTSNILKIVDNKAKLPDILMGNNSWETTANIFKYDNGYGACGSYSVLVDNEYVYFDEDNQLDGLYCSIVYLMPTHDQIPIMGITPLGITPFGKIIEPKSITTLEPMAATEKTLHSTLESLDNKDTYVPIDHVKKLVEEAYDRGFTNGKALCNKVIEYPHIDDFLNIEKTLEENED